MAKTKDNFTGTRNDDFLSGNDLDNILSGLGGNDTLLGLAGNDVLKGGKGNDTLWGGVGDDNLVGGDGNDTLIVSANYSSSPRALTQGNDVLTGGDGNDIFTFDIGPMLLSVGGLTVNTHLGNTVITDFQPGDDLINFTFESESMDLNVVLNACSFTTQDVGNDGILDTVVEYQHQITEGTVTDPNFSITLIGVSHTDVLNAIISNGDQML